MAEELQPADLLSQARKLLMERLIIEDERVAFAYQTESDVPIQQADLLFVNTESGEDVRVPLAVRARALAASGRTGTRWRNIGRTDPAQLAEALKPGQWRLYLITDATTAHRPAPGEGILKEPVTISAGLFDFRFYRSPIGLLMIDIERRKMLPLQDAFVAVHNVSHLPGRKLRISGTVNLFGKPLTSMACELQIHSRDAQRVLSQTTTEPNDGRFDAILPISGLPFGIHDILLNLPFFEVAVRIRYSDKLVIEAEAPDEESQETRATVYRTPSGFLALYVTPAAANFEISSIQATQTTFLIAGAVGGTSEADRTARRVINRYQCFAIGRDTGDEIELGVSFDEGKFHIKFAPQSLDNIDFGIWDIAMKSPRGELCFLARGEEEADVGGTPVVCSSVSGAAAAIECLTTTPERIAISVQPLLKASRLERLAVGNTLSMTFEIETRGVSVATLFAGAKTALLVSFGAMPVHRMPGRAQFVPIGACTCRVTLECALGDVAPERLRKVIANCAVGIEFKGPNIDGTAPLEIDDSKIFTTGLRAAVETPWTKVLSTKSGERIYNSSARRNSSQSDIAFFATRANEGYSGNAKAISQALLRRAPQIEQVWVLDDPEQAVGQPGTAVRPGSADYYGYLARARYIIGDAELPSFFEKRSGTIYLQTSIPMRDGEIAFDATALGRWDIVLSPHAYATKRLKQMLGFSGEIVEQGNPRNDILIDAAAREQTAARLRAEFGIHPNKQIILYVPESQDSRPPISLRSLQNAVGSDHVLLLRLPPGAANEFEWLGGFSGFAVNVSKYESLTDLMCVADIFVTDTSSSMVDFALTGKPMIFYMRDAVHLDPNFVDNAPGPIARRQFGLTRVLQRMDHFAERYAPAYDTFVKTYCSQDEGNAAEVVVARLLARGGVSGLR
jgi:CDP-glycerol glycerophosphotransferase (TagB/SpsB family)